MSFFSSGIGKAITSGLKQTVSRGVARIDGVNVLNALAPDFVMPGSTGVSDPTSIIRRNTNSVGHFQFPDDIGKYYLSMKFFEYKRPSVFAKLQLKTDNFLVLPFPENLTDEYRLEYGDKDQLGIAGYAAEALTAVGVQGVNPVGGVGDALRKDAASISAGLPSSVGKITDAIKSALPSGVTDNLGRIGSGGTALVAAGGSELIHRAAGTTLGTAALQTLGLAENPYMTVVFSGPRFKTHTLRWLFSPRTSAESSKLTQIINMFKKAAHPELAAGTAAYIYPNILQIEIKPDDTAEHMYKFKMCVITGVDVNYAPTQPAFFQGTGAPVQVGLTLNLQEIELWTAEDWAGTDTGVTRTDIVDRVKQIGDNTSRVFSGKSTAGNPDGTTPITTDVILNGGV